MRNEAVVIVLFLLIVPTALQSADPSDLPVECEGVDFSPTGRPVMFPFRSGLLLGLSALRPTFPAAGPISLSVWVVNHADDEQSLMTCSDVEWWTLDLDVYDSHWNRAQTVRERTWLQNPQSKPELADLRFCSRNFAVKIPPHTCGPLHDRVRFVTTDLAARYDLATGEYFVTPKKITFPLRALQISVVDSSSTQSSSPHE